MTNKETLKYYLYVMQCNNSHCQKTFGSDFKKPSCPYCYRILKKKQVEIRRRYKKLSLLNGGKSI